MLGDNDDNVVVIFQIAGRLAAGYACDDFNSVARADVAVCRACHVTDGIRPPAER
jgi:hypothetical protein